MRSQQKGVHRPRWTVRKRWGEGPEPKP